MYSPKRRFRLFRHPGWAGGTIDDTTVYTYTWAEQTNAPSQRYTTFGVDDTGNVMISARWDATDGREGPYISTDKGATWSRKVTGMTFNAASTTNNATVARSNPDIMYCPVLQSYLYKSTDRGENWTAFSGPDPMNNTKNWNCVACSSDGSNVVAAITGTTVGFIYKSTDAGSNWTKLTGAGDGAWDELFISEDGETIAGCRFNNYVYVSTDGGSNWSSNTGEGLRLWRGLSGSADGTVLFASAVNGALTNGSAVLSTDSGQTWTDLSNSLGGSGYYWETATSINGNKLVTAKEDGSIYISQDGGTTWSAQSTPGTGKTWEGLGMSPDGKTIIVGRNNGKPWVATGA